MEAWQIGIASGIFGGLSVAAYGLLMPRRNCPECGEPLPKVRNHQISDRLCGAVRLAGSAVAKWIVEESESRLEAAGIHHGSEPSSTCEPGTSI